MLTLGNLSPQEGSTKQRKRLGRGPGSGHGKTAGRGHKGFKSRSGSGIKPGFEGGQMPLQRRLPKRGFTNIFKKEFSLVALSQLDKFEAGVVVSPAELVEAGMVKKGTLIKILANGEITKAVTVKVDKISSQAKAQIEAAGGTVVLTEVTAAE
ncbi:50S ribosomal protein L15 [Desulfotalea psychrophila]|uniref:Large ribosomal subunit protein uL15 n=1 Tax=Desulfotalea psychrophila (strain LSv54 / DSM 12343) TaxID=177439 RepID=RL15_DESPS|nr:50S ribosomal protein L15 [Desulfotalea psychrophila]Q6AP51.2 RecName: Full=Large ribosomal subunit protein uL15; AltName: Full=50S ribosomal protein L15 [Desulfotalea psychrophila LSv54]